MIPTKSIFIFFITFCVSFVLLRLIVAEDVLPKPKYAVMHGQAQANGLPWVKERFYPIGSAVNPKGYECRTGITLHDSEGNKPIWIRNPIYDGVDRVIIGVFGNVRADLASPLQPDALGESVAKVYRERFRKLPDGVKETDSPWCYNRNNQPVDVMGRDRNARIALKEAARDKHTLNVQVHVRTQEILGKEFAVITVTHGRYKSGSTIFDGRTIANVFDASMANGELQKEVNAFFESHMEP